MRKAPPESQIPVSMNVEGREEADVAVMYLGVMYQRQFILNKEFVCILFFNMYKYLLVATMFFLLRR